MPSCCASTWPLASVAPGDSDLLGGPGPELPGLSLGKGPRERLGAPGAHAAGSGGAGRCSGLCFSIWGKMGASPHGLVSSTRCPLPRPFPPQPPRKAIFLGPPSAKVWSLPGRQGPGSCCSRAPPWAGWSPLPPQGHPLAPPAGGAHPWCGLAPTCWLPSREQDPGPPHPVTEPSQLTPAWARGAQAGIGSWLGRKFPRGL